MIIMGIAGPVRPAIIKYAIDTSVAIGDYQGLIKLIIGLIGLLVIQSIVQYLYTYYSGWLGQNIIKDIRIKLYRHIQSLKLKFYDKTPIGRLVTRNISDIETLAEVFSTGIAGIIADIFQLIVILGFMFWMNWKLTIVSLSLLPVLLFATYIFKEKIKDEIGQRN